MAGESYVEIDSLLGNTLFLATGLSWSSIFQGFVLLIALLVSRQSIKAVRCRYTNCARRRGSTIPGRATFPFAVPIASKDLIPFFISGGGLGVKVMAIVPAETIEATVWLSSCMTRSKMVNPCGGVSATIWWPNG